MDQKTTSSGSGGGTRKNWRERLGINKDLPKIAAEFKEERRPPPPPPPLRPAMPPAKGAAGRLSTGTGQQVARPAPMAPRVGAGGAPPRPAGAKPGTAPPKLNVPRPPAATPPAPSARAVPDPAPPEPAVEDAPPVEEAKSKLPPLPADDDFSARLKAQREAAERLARQRVGSLRKQADEEPAAEPTETEDEPETSEAEPVEATTDEAAAPVEETPEAVEEDVTPAAEAAAESESGEGEEPEEPEEPDQTAEPEDVVEEQPQEAKRPKFGFAPEELTKPIDEDVAEQEVAKSAEPAKPEPAASPVLEPRMPTAAALSVPPQSRQSASPPRQPAPPPAQPARPQPQRTSLRGIDPEPARPAQPQQARPQHGLSMPRGYPPTGQPPAGAPQAQNVAGAGGPPPLRAPARPGEAAYSPYAAQAAQQPAGGAPAQAPRADLPPPGRSKPGRSLDYVDDDLSEVFEDERKPALGQRRASAEDYSAAYRDFDEAFEEEEPQRSNGPIVLILGLVTIALIAGALVYLYRTSQGPDAAKAGGGEIPVVTQPADPVKEPPSAKEDPQAPATSQTRNKQIYDRIVGDEETTEPEKIVPSEETPQLPATNESTTPSASETEPLPLPLPPPPGSDQQGALPDSGAQTTARADPIEPAGGNELPIPEPAGTAGQTAIAAPPVPGSPATTAAQGGDLVAALPLPAPPAPATVTPPAATEAVAPPEPAPVTSLNRPPKPRNRPARLATLARTQAPAATTQPAPVPQPAQQIATAPSPGSGPTVLAPAPTTIQTQQAAQPGDTSPGFKLPNFLQQAQSGTDDQAPRRLPTGRGDDDPLAGSRNSVNSTTSGTVAAPQQVTALQPQQPAAPSIVQQPAPSVTPQQQPSPSVLQQLAPTTPKAAAPSGSGYVVQLASYRSESEALSEFQQLRARHGGLIGGLSSRIQKAELGAAGTFYRLGVGPIGDKTSAKKLCNSLIAAGEKDCLVRRQ